MFELWNFQKKIVAEAQEAVRKHKSIGIIMPTGSGKTAVSADISLQIYNEIGGGDAAQGSVLYLVHRRELLTQTAKTLDKIGMEGTYGFIVAGEEGEPWLPIQIASIPTLIRRLDKLKHTLNPRVIFVDEGHHAVADTWERVIRTWPNAFVIFLTATPARGDDKGLGDIIDHLVLGPQIRELVPEFLAPIRTYSVAPEFNMTRASLKMQSEHQTGAVIASAVDNWLELASDRKTIFFAVDLDHSQRIVQQLREKGITAAHMDYKTSDDERKRIFEDLLAGRIQCISNMKLFTEGTDWPDCNCVVLARNTGSLVEYRQMNGRAMRRKKDGGDSIILDLAGNVYTHGMPDDDIHWELEYGVTKEEKKKLASSGRVCENCDYFYSKKEFCCPLCGQHPLRPVVMEVDAEISEIDSINAVPKKRVPTNKRLLAQRVKETRGDKIKLEALRKEYGYHRNWAVRMHQVYGHNWERR